MKGYQTIEEAAAKWRISAWTGSPSKKSSRKSRSRARTVNDNPIVRDFDELTRQRYLAALAANGVHTVTVKPGN